MKCFVQGKPADAALLAVAEEEPIVCFAPPSERSTALAALNVAHTLAGTDASQHRSTRFESQTGYDYMVLSIPDLHHIMHETSQVEIFFTGSRLLFVGDELPVFKLLLEDITGWQGEPPLAERVLLQFFTRLTGDDAAFLEDIEEEIAALEDRMMVKKPEDCTHTISILRKKLLVLKRYYEAMFDLLEDMEANENCLLSKNQLRYLHLQTNRADRLTHAVTNLRDYVTQVRESYQNQLDISLNETMKLFTVITAIFLPLTLIVGWYGMNLQMPEYENQYAYPLTIALCVAVVAGCLWYFKKHRWF